MSSYLKKRVLHNKKLDYIESRNLIRPIGDDLPFYQEYHIYEGQITPTTMIKSRKAYDITFLHPLLVIGGLVVLTENELVKNIMIMGIHPNVDPKTKLYCLPEYRKEKKFTQRYFELFLDTLKIYYLDDCYFQPTKQYVTYKPLKSMSIQLNQEE